MIFKSTKLGFTKISEFTRHKYDCFKSTKLSFIKISEFTRHKYDFLNALS